MSLGSFHSSHEHQIKGGSIGVASVEGDRRCCHTSNAPLHVGEVIILFIAHYICVAHPACLSMCVYDPPQNSLVI